MSHDTESEAKFEAKLTLRSKNDMRDFVDFHVSSGKSKKFHFTVLLLSIAYNVSAKKVQNHVIEEKNDFFFEKW